MLEGLDCDDHDAARVDYYSGCPLNTPVLTGFLTDDIGVSPFRAHEGPLRMWVR